MADIFHNGEVPAMPNPVPGFQNTLHRQLLIVDAPPGGSVLDSPQLTPWLEEDWQVLEISPRVTETGARHLLVLGKGERIARPAASPGDEF